MSVVLGVDAHKRTHTAVAVNSVGRKLGEKTVAATSLGHTAAMMWAWDRFGRDLVWGVEDCRPLTALLERELLAAGQSVVRVPPHLMSRSRSSARAPGKSDSIDALAVARAVLREPDLPVARHDYLSMSLKLLVDRREDLVGIRQSTINRLLWRVHELDPTHSKPANWQRKKTRGAMEAVLQTHTGMIAELARAELDDINRLSEAIDELTQRIATAVATAAPALLSVPGCGELTAAKVVAETAGVDRFKSEAAFARYVGAAPTPHWSGNVSVRVRPNRRGNRQLNAALHRIAVTQIRLDGCPGRTYHRRRIEEGDTRSKALRALKRRVSRAVFQALKADRAHENAHVAV